MKIVIVGLGKHGKTICSYLTKEKDYDIIAIDTDPVEVENCINQFDVMGYCGNGATLDCLKGASANKADVLIACTGVDETNILVCLVAKKLGIKRTIARIKDKDYTKQINALNDELGISYAFNPYYGTALEIIRDIRFPSAIKREVLADGKVDIVEIRVDENSILKNKTLIEIREELNIVFIIAAVVRDDKTFIPRGNFVIQEGDVVYITASEKDLGYTYRKIAGISDKVKDVFIIGGGKLASFTTQELLDMGIHVTIIESNKESCDKLASTFKEATVINCDADNQKVMLNEGIENTDCVLALTSSDETNIVVSCFCKNIGVKKIITKLNNDNYSLILTNEGIETIVSPRVVFTHNVIKAIRAMETSRQRNLEFKSMYSLVNEEIIALEFLVPKESSFTNVPIKDLKLSSDVLIAAIIRDGTVIMPRGSDVIEVDDEVVIISQNNDLKNFKDIFE